mmetsp:Transcript_36963/g.147429  ORF Transcript_36963/g.147429 Transcript_36963/m.147429 type:complete len:90 (-) Transcript_36963:584-853(-)
MSQNLQSLVGEPPPGGEKQIPVDLVGEDIVPVASREAGELEEGSDYSAPTADEGKEHSEDMETSPREDVVHGFLCWTIHWFPVFLLNVP